MVVDLTGAVIAGALVGVRQKGTGGQRTVETTFDGKYQMEGLDPGEYELTVARAGFAAKTYQLTFRVGEQLSLNFQLEVGPLVESVTVTGTATPVDLSNYALSGVVGRSQIENLPLNGRNFLALARLESGVNVVSTGNPGAFGKSRIMAAAFPATGATVSMPHSRPVSELWACGSAWNSLVDTSILIQAVRAPQ
jgi:hypothetical protein